MRELLESIHFYVKILKIGGKFTIGLRKGYDISVGHLIKIEFFFFQNQPCHTSKEAEFNIDSKI
jgi:hypothetical protein